jgi:hypothetical protein
MKLTFKHSLIALFATLTLAGCASNNEQQRELELQADRRANILASNLPLEYGPLTITRATSKNEVVIIEMLYNQAGSKPADQLMASAKNYYCASDDVKAAMDEGIRYLIKIRNSRGQVVVEEIISSQTCLTMKDKK